jgi:hypothetical protein
MEQGPARRVRATLCIHVLYNIYIYIYIHTYIRTMYCNTSKLCFNYWFRVVSSIIRTCWDHAFVLIRPNAILKLYLPNIWSRQSKNRVLFKIGMRARQTTTRVSYTYTIAYAVSCISSDCVALLSDRELRKPMPMCHLDVCHVMLAYLHAGLSCLRLVDSGPMVVGSARMHASAETKT